MCENATKSYLMIAISRYLWKQNATTPPRGWNSAVVMMPTLSSVEIMTTSGADRDSKVGIMTTPYDKLRCSETAKLASWVHEQKLASWQLSAVNVSPHAQSRWRPGFEPWPLRNPAFCHVKSPPYLEHKLSGLISGRGSAWWSREVISREMLHILLLSQAQTTFMFWRHMGLVVVNTVNSLRLSDAYICVSKPSHLWLI